MFLQRFLFLFFLRLIWQHIYLLLLLIISFLYLYTGASSHSYIYILAHHLIPIFIYWRIISFLYFLDLQIIATLCHSVEVRRIDGDHNELVEIDAKEDAEGIMANWVPGAVGKYRITLKHKDFLIKERVVECRLVR